VSENIKNCSVVIYPNFNSYYYSFYLYGLLKKYKKIKYSNRDFPEFHHHCLAIIIIDNKREYKIYISAGDGPGFNQKGLKWCDVYAKVNIEKNSIPKEYYHKVLPIGPSFGINLFNTYLTITTGLITLTKSKIPFKKYRDHIANYFRQRYYRSSLSEYSHEKGDSNYIFYAGTLWRKEKKTNEARSNFMNSVINNPNIIFEGGFAPGKEEFFKIFDYLIMNQKYSHKNYINNLKKSLLGFNTPAVKGCLGWKLGEYLALGKAIISTPINNLLPSPLIHGEHIHYIDGSKKSIKNSIEEIRSNESYKEILEKNSREYFLKYLSPESVIDRIISFAEKNSSI
tara:strand:+ start:4302 stop:5321 length:1020 start_codon:yes stop_codon:yes gene_type:complete